MPRRRCRFLMIREDLRKHPNVIAMALALQVDRDLVVGKLVAFWDWVKSVSRDGNIFVLPLCAIDSECDFTGFAEQLLRVGWLEELAAENAGKQGWRVPEFDAWLSEDASRKADAAMRMSRYRDAKVSQESNGGVTKKRHHIRLDKNRLEESLFTTTETPLLNFPTRGKEKEWGLLPSKVEEFAQAFPEKDILGEARKALAWLQQDSARLKTARGMGRFLYSWLARAQDRPGALGGMAGGSPQPPRPLLPAKPSGVELLEQLRREQQDER